MNTQTITINEGYDWTQIPKGIVTNRSSYLIEYTIDTSIPNSDSLGHIINPNDGVSFISVGDGDIYVRSIYKSAKLSVSL